MNSLTVSQKSLLWLMKKSFFRIDFVPEQETDWNDIYSIAFAQAVIPIVFDSFNGLDLPKDIKWKFKNFTMSVLSRNDIIKSRQDEIVKLLEANKIRYAIIKGLSVARFYPNPSLRTLGDIDILVNNDDFERTNLLLIENDYIKDENEHDFHSSFYKNDVCFEIHFALSEFTDSKLEKKLENDLNFALEKTDRVSLDGSSFEALNEYFTALSLLVHMERHIRLDGLGLRQLIDWGFFCVKTNFLDSKINQDSLSKYGLLTLAQVSYDLFKIYFLNSNFQNPKADKLLELSFSKGNFGVNRSKSESHASEVLSEDNKKHRFVLVNWYLYLRDRSLRTWKLAQKFHFFSYFGFLYLPLRYLFRRIFKKTECVNLKEIYNSSNELTDVLDDLNIYK